MKTKILVGFFALLTTMSFEGAFASHGRSLVLNPRTYTSSSGVYSLLVDPTDINGAGPGDCRFTKDGKTLWQRQLPYTFWDAAVTDSGQVVGFAYTEGVESQGEFIVAILSAEGQVVGKEKHKRESSRYLHASPDPGACGMFLDGLQKQAVVRIPDADLNRHIEQWWVFDLASGKRVSTLKPGRSMPKKKTGESHSLIVARAVLGTSLVLMHWWKYQSPGTGGIFTLINLNSLARSWEG